MGADPGRQGEGVPHGKQVRRVRRGCVQVPVRGGTSRRADALPSTFIFPLFFFPILFPKTKYAIPPARDVTRRFRPARVRRCATTWIRRCSRVLNPPARRAPAATRAPRNASSRHPAAASATPLRATRRDLEAPLEAPLEATRRDRRPVRADPRGRRRRVRSEGHLFLLLLLLLLLRPPVHRPLPDHPTGRRRDPGLLRRLAVERRRAPSAAATATTTKATTTRTRG